MAGGGSGLFALVAAMLSCLVKGMDGLRMTTLKIPQHVVLNQTVRMECNFNLDRETLYSVKWYKDGHEFYRYVPSEQPDVYVFQLPGVFVDKYSSSGNAVVLHRVNRDSTGRYRCEVSAEAPFFNTISDHADMIVVVLPEKGPAITGGKQRYQPGDVVRVNCTSAPSKPPAQLTWYVNGEPADNKFLRGPRTINVDLNGLETAQLGLEFHAWSKHFRLGDMKLKCMATISTIYKRSNEHRVTGVEGFVKQPMESRETRAQSHTRAEYSNGSEACASTTILSVLSVLAFFFDGTKKRR